MARARSTSATINAQALFRDGKEAGALRTIGEVATALGLRQHVLRYWEEQFSMLRPLTRAGGRRYYRPADIALVIEIDRLLNREGYTVRGALQALEPVAGAVGATPEHSLVSAVGVLRRHLEAIRDRLAHALGADSAS